MGLYRNWSSASRAELLSFSNLRVTLGTEWQDYHYLLISRRLIKIRLIEGVDIVLRHVDVGDKVTSPHRHRCGIGQDGRSPPIPTKMTRFLVWVHQRIDFARTAMIITAPMTNRKIVIL
jgi:hypothetical protein